MAPPANQLSEIEKKVFDFVNRNDVNGLKSHILEHKLGPDLCDENGMTPLNQAAFRGCKAICQLLLDHGADVNCKKHEHGYTALHFAALSGNAELCHLLLDYGAESHPVNSTGRTPAQMAAFVGNRNCVSVINYYLPRSEIDRYTLPQGLADFGRLPLSFVLPLYKYVINHNIHPVRLALNLSPTLVEDLNVVKGTLKSLCNKQMGPGGSGNEVMSLKLHYFAGVVGEVAKCTSPDNQSNPIELFVRKILVKKRGEEYMDYFIKEIIREFPFRQCVLFRQMIMMVANSRESPSALSVMMTVIVGQQGFGRDVKTCATCCQENANKKCSKCKQVQYCDRECQRLHWFVHKKECNRNIADDIAPNRS